MLTKAKAPISKCICEISVSRTATFEVGKPWGRRRIILFKRSFSDHGLEEAILLGALNSYVFSAGSFAFWVPKFVGPICPQFNKKHRGFLQEAQGVCNIHPPIPTLHHHDLFSFFKKPHSKNEPDAVTVSEVLVCQQPHTKRNYVQSNLSGEQTQKNKKFSHHADKTCSKSSRHAGKAC